MKVAGYEARTLRISIPPDPSDPAGEGRVVELLAPARAADLVDRERLLRDPDPPDPPYWVFPWGGAHAVARAVLGPDGPARGATVLDLGCGLGLAGIAAGLRGATPCFADLSGDALAFAEASARANGLVDARTLVVDLTRDHLARRFDWILAADLLYEPRIYAPLARFLTEHLVPGGTALVTDRMLEAPRVFFRSLEERGFVDVVSLERVPEGGQTVPTRLHRLRAPDAPR